MAGYQDGEMPAQEQVTTGADVFGGESGLPVHPASSAELDEVRMKSTRISGATGAQVGSWNVQVNNYIYGETARSAPSIAGSYSQDFSETSGMLMPRTASRPGLSPEGAARSEFRELRAAQRLAAGRTLRRPDMSDGDATDGRVQCPMCLRRFDWAEASQSIYAWSHDHRDHVPLHRRVGELDQHWNQRKANGVVLCGSSSDEWRHYLPALYGAYGEPIVIAAVGDVNSGKTTLLTMLGVELERSSVLHGKLSFRALSQDLEARFYAHYARPLLEERRVLAATSPSDNYGFFHAWRGFNNLTGRPFILAFFDASGENFAYQESIPPFVNAASAFIFLADADAMMDGRAADIATGNVINALDPRRFGGLPVATVITKSDLFQERREVLNWLSRDDEASPGTIEQESEDAYAFLAQTSAPGWLRPIREFPSATLHFLSATGTGIIDRNSLQFDQSHFGPRRVLRPILSLLNEIGVIDSAQFTSHGGSR
jgi:hypothetical protein